MEIQISQLYSSSVHSLVELISKVWISFLKPPLILFQTFGEVFVDATVKASLMSNTLLDVEATLVLSALTLNPIIDVESSFMRLSKPLWFYQLKTSQIPIL